jgi:DNA-binding response OmpR family regulator
MPARIAVVHDEPEFVDRATSALVLAGYELAAFTDPLVAPKTLEAAQHPELLIAPARLPPREGRGISFALTARPKRRGVGIIFIAQPECRDQAMDLGKFQPIQIGIPALVQVVGRLLGQTGHHTVNP